MNLAKQGLQAYEASHSNNNGSSAHSQAHASRPNFNHDEVVQTATQHGSGYSDMFSQAMQHVNNNTHAHEEPIDQAHVVASHQEVYQNGNASSLSAGSMGSAAALETFQKFAGGGASGGGSKSQLISMAMAEASKLFDKSGGAASGSKQDAINGAGMMVMKMLVQSKMSGGGGGGSGGSSQHGGMGDLMSLASKFL
ncbi:hypothetical protein BDP27DRAFT_1443765 [Rhodocollybia butyracea]|uniref:DUF7721 domain-containing protein n=1 Tax=Rhodocollybia butyracea TaxID=206335 RepID=A0A9P5UD46_9AGAR|nr:hypothetical protein BDP27DRAFT_1443765 [Rhodocollybia butyracea]